MATSNNKVLRAAANRVFRLLSKEIRTASLSDEEQHEYESLEDILERAGIRIKGKPLHTRLYSLLQSGLLNETNAKQCRALYEKLSKFQELLRARHAKVYGIEFDELVGYLLSVFSTRGISSKEFEEGFGMALTLRDAIETERRVRERRYAEKAGEFVARERKRTLEFLRRRRPR